MIAQVVAQVARRDGDRLKVFAFLVLFAAAARRVEAIEQDFLPVDLARALVFGFCLRGLCGLAFLLLLLVFLGLDKVEERVVEKLLLQVLLQIEQWHVEKIHRLVQARIDLQLLPQLGRLIQAGLQEAATPSLARENLSRSRAVSVGPR